jgi:flagellar motility protein MotE (MotC chaperone)
MKKLLQSPWTAGAVGAVLYVVTMTVCWHPEKQGSVETTARKPSPAGPSWTFHNPEIEQLVGELKKEKLALADKEKQLDELAVRLNSERQELNQVTQTVQELQAQFDRNVVHVEEQESSNLKKLAKVYSSMAPDSAVQILKQMDEGTVVKMFSMMKEVEASPLLEAMAKQGEPEAKRAAELSERLRLALAKPLPGAPRKP